MNPTIQQGLTEYGYYRSQSWLAQTDRYPFTQNPLRLPGHYPYIQLPFDLKSKVNQLKPQIAAVLSICPCRINESEISLLSIPPFTESAPFCQKAVIDLQTGDLWFLKEPTVLAIPNATDWQYFLQFPVSL